MTKKERAKRHLLHFEGYWINVLEVRIENVRKLVNTKNAKSCKNRLVISLVSTYITESINKCLIKFYEVFQLISMVDKSWDKKYLKIHEPKLFKLYQVRNKLVAHAEESKGGIEYEDLSREYSHSNFKILDDLIEGYELINAKIESLKLGTKVVSNWLEYEFDKSDLEILPKLPSPLSLLELD